MDSIGSALLVLSPNSTEPIRIEVVLTTSDEVLELRRKLAEVEASYLQLLADHKRTEYRYACEVTQKMQMVDWLRENKINCPKRFFDSPYT